MFNELTVKTSAGEFSAFLQDGFYENTLVNNIHNHNFTEVHLIMGDEIVFDIEGVARVINGAAMLVIPKRCFHVCTSHTTDVKRTAFQISLEVDKVQIIPISEQILLDFLHEIAICRNNSDYTRVAAYIALFCSSFLKGDAVTLNEMRDYGFLIHEFLSLNYSRDVQLSDLADHLHLCERQAERLVVKTVGKPFRRALAEMRINIAKMLMRNTNMSRTQIASYVGYNSYAGFWKAMKYEETK